MADKKENQKNFDLFESLKKELSRFDPVAFAENHLTIDGDPFNMSGAGYKYLAEVYRSIGTQAENKNAKPTVILKGRQVGATILAAALSLYFTTSGLYGTEREGYPPIRILHLFPTLPIMHKYTKDKLEAMMRTSQDNFVAKRSMKADKEAVAMGFVSEDTLTEKSFIGNNKIRIDAIGKDADRIRGLTQDVMFFDECFPYNQCVETEFGKTEIGVLYKMWENGEVLPKVKSYNQNTKGFEYKSILNAWKKGERDLIQVNCGRNKIRCTPDHLFLTKSGWKKASNLSGEFIKVAQGSDKIPNFENHGFFAVDDIIKANKEEVFDIEVEDNHNFIVTSGINSKDLGGPVVHNCQDMTKSAIENALRILTAAQYGKPTQGVQLYFGTPKNTGSYFWQLWEDSDQRYYQLGCVSCEHFFFLYRYGTTEWRDVWVKDQIVKCPECECEQDKREAIDRGRWKATKDSSTSRYTGYHINLMLSPRFTKEMVQDYDPAFNPSRSERAWKNETIGEFYSSGGMPLTMEDLVHNALNETRGISKGTKSKNPNKIYTLGIDWGDKSLDTDDDLQKGQSYTALCVLSCENGRFTVENAFRLRNNNFSHRVKVVEEIFKRYNIRNAAADYMFGNDVVNFLQVDKGYRSRLLGCINSGTLGKTLSFDPKLTRVVVNHHMMIDDMFSMFRRGLIKFPVAGSSWDSLLWLMQHCTSMEAKKGMKADNYVKRYVKGSNPNDGLMAMMYAMIAYKFVATGGFTERKEEENKASFPQPLLAYAPNIGF